MLNVEDDPAALAAAAATRIASLLRNALERRGVARLCLTGGQTPRELYHLLSDPGATGSSPIAWNAVELFWGDERHVPPDHPDSNYRMAQESLIAPAAIPAERVHRMRGELPDAADAAHEYDGMLRTFQRSGQAMFDVMLLGLGSDAHIASLFPGSPLLTTLAPDTHDALCRAVWAPHLDTWRITLTPQALLDADAVLVITAGEEKAAAVHSALRVTTDVSRWPAQMLRAAGERVEWWLDTAAAAGL